MGLTVHYDLKTTSKSRDRVIGYLEQARQMAMDLAFEEISDLVVYENPTEHTVDEEHSWMFIQSDTSVDIPWTRSKIGGVRRRVHAEWFAGFTAWPGEGCESMEIVLAQHPRTIEVQYKPEDDSRFRGEAKPDELRFGYRFDWKKWEQWCKRNNRTDLDVNYGKVNQSGKPFEPFYNPARLYETRTIKVPGSGKMNCSAFCKTQYASKFGMAHFVRCHLSVCHLLRRLETIPTLSVQINDEGKYETSYHTDDWTVENPHYYWHDAKYDVDELVKECGEWNEMIAGFAGAFSDTIAKYGMSDEAPIKAYRDFERLEAKGREKEHVDKFVQALAAIARSEVEAKIAEEEADA